MAQQIGRAKTVKEAYTALVIVKAANVEGMALPSYEDYLKELEEFEK